MKKRYDDRQWGSQHTNPSTKQSFTDGRRCWVQAFLCLHICVGWHSSWQATGHGAHLSRTVSNNSGTLSNFPNGARHWHYPISILKPLRMTIGQVHRSMWDLNNAHLNCTKHSEKLSKEKITKNAFKVRLEVQMNKTYQPKSASEQLMTC